MAPAGRHRAPGTLLASAAVALLVLALNAAQAAGPGPALIERGWEAVTFEGKPANAYRLTSEGAIEVVSERSVSLIQRPVTVDIEATPLLAWRWRVDRGVPATDLTRKGGDDRSLAIYVTFPFRPGEASLLERMRRAMVEAMAGGAAPGRVLCYVFGGEGQRGAIQQNPWFGDAGASLILRPAGSATGTWLEERVDLAADYRQVFGGTPDDPTHLAISADSDDTGGRVRAFVDGLRFQTR
ncbi:MAG TPA: DUF3047 domain-containing protein [Geminicoccaceae bacterium]